MGLFKNSYEGMQWYKDMSEADKAAYRAKHHNTQEYQNYERDLADQDWYAWEQQRSIPDKILDPIAIPPHPFYGKTAGEKVSSLLRWIF